MKRHILVAFLIFIAGCASMKAHKQGLALEETCKKYGRALQWSQFHKAVGFMSPDTEKPGATDLNGLRNIRVSSYEVLDRQVLDEGNEASQTVEIRYYHAEDLIERTILDKQTWRYDDNKESWFLISGLPLFKDDLTQR